MTQTKICGINTAEALEAAIQAGTDYIGLVLFPKSPRNVEFDQAEELAELARGRVKIVALVVDPGPAMLSVLRNNIRPDIVQLHGHETPDLVERFKRALPGIALWKAVPVSQQADIEAAETYLDENTRASRLLFDAKPPENADLPGGNGLSFDWRILKGVASRYPYVLAGGLTPENVAKAIELTGAAIVDVSSGVETEPGKKSPELMTRFIMAVKSVTNNETTAA
ncbi:MAG: phosphoribosylanthranilate isomerase [Pseudomonadota bacterium]